MLHLMSQFKTLTVYLERIDDDTPLASKEMGSSTHKGPRDLLNQKTRMGLVFVETYVTEKGGTQPHHLQTDENCTAKKTYG